MSTAHKLAWCAGFFDGEGYVTIQKRQTKYKNKVYISHYLRIGINHVAKEPLEEILKVLGGTLRQQSSHSVVGNRKQRWSWQMGCNQAKEALLKMMPYFKNKNRVAELGIELQNTMQTSKKEVTNDLYLYRQLLKEKISTLNEKD